MIRPRWRREAAHPPKCYADLADTGEGRCPNDARYEAAVDWSAGLQLFCDEHAARARALDEVLMIRSLPRAEYLESDVPELRAMLAVDGKGDGSWCKN